MLGVVFAPAVPKPGGSSSCRPTHHMLIVPVNPVFRERGMASRKVGVATPAGFRRTLRDMTEVSVTVATMICVCLRGS